MTLKSIFYLSLSLLVICTTLSCTQEDRIEYSSQVKPILNARCLACHGGVRKQGGFSLLFEKEALATLPSGNKGIVPHSAKRSEMIRRLTLEDEEERMPYKEHKLSGEEIDILTKWVNQGAEWGEHWAYQSLKKPVIPQSDDSNWGSNHIDAYILSKLESNELTPSPVAEPAILARRLSLDMIGYPLGYTDVQSFLDDPTDEQYEQLVDTLLFSSHYGEKWTSMWLDLARYADTKGYERDDNRNIWRYRDWVIKAFNEDKGYDQFITEQLAGDLLENPTDEQYLATAFHRNTMTNDEGGTDNEEFRNAAIIDRVNTTWEALMGTTFACVQCHSHPYDPFTHEEYYQSFAIFNNTRDEDSFADYPVLRHLDSIQLEKVNSFRSWLSTTTTPEHADEIATFLKTIAPAQNSLTTDKFVNSELSDTKWLSMRNNSSARLKNVDLTGRDQLIFRHIPRVDKGSLQLHIDAPDGQVIGTFDIVKPDKSGWIESAIDIKSIDGTHDIYFTYENNKLKDPDQNGITFDWFYFTQMLPEDDLISKEYKKQFWELVEADVPATPIMIENPERLKRATHLFAKGSWLSPEQEVEPGIPGVLNEFPEGTQPNRLGLAKWMIDPKHPLTSRTIVNRVWEQIFGVGLVETLEDMGSQGSNPSNKELLDYLSWQLIHEYDWSLKSLIKEIVMSDSYKQSSHISDEQLSLDPSNTYLARMNRVRLSGEQIRDQALAISGAMNPKMYGQPVMPYQPEGIWSAPYDGNKWNQSKGDDQYRRAVYTFWKRTSPYPALMTFDGVGRESCSSRRIRTNTPLQALNTLNDPVYMDLSKKLTERVWNNDPKTMIQEAYRLATYQDISPNKLEILNALYTESLTTYQQNSKLTKEITQGSTTKELESFAAMVIVSNAIINLDEVITKT